jgi:hypothetical protein
MHVHFRGMWILLIVNAQCFVVASAVNLRASACAQDSKDNACRPRSVSVKNESCPEMLPAAIE